MHAADTVLLGFARAVRKAGVPVTTDRAQTFLTGTSLVGADQRDGVYWAGRGTLCTGPDDIDRYDRVFSSWFTDHDLPRPRSGPAPRTVRQADLTAGGVGDDGEESVLRTVASDTEVLRHRDVAELNAGERYRLGAMFDALVVQVPTRRSHRRQRFHRGDIDARATVRDQIRRAGEPGRIRYARERRRARRVVLLIDVSGSMEAYADALLRLAHRVVTAAPHSTEVFTVGTRLTRVTRALRLRDPEQALREAGRTVPDWSGGTRLGESLRVFTDRWGQRGMARGSVVVVASDGWERGDPVLLGEQTRRLARIAHSVVWMNPHRGKPGYLPVQSGIAAALPYVDALVAGHSMQSFAELLEVIGDA
ncbi:MAG: vWA domain-containing protein [Nocardioidaceae bacterium]